MDPYPERGLRRFEHYDAEKRITEMAKERDVSPAIFQVAVFLELENHWREIRPPPDNTYVDDDDRPF